MGRIRAIFGQPSEPKGDSPGLTPVDSYKPQNESTPLASKRFVLVPPNTHEHYLRTSKRKEKLGKMLKDFLMAKDKLNAESEGVLLDSEALAAVEKTKPLLEDMGGPMSLFGGLVSELGSLAHAKNAKDPQAVLDGLMKMGNKSTDFQQRYGHTSEIVGKGSFGVVKMSYKVDPSNKQRRLLFAIKEFKPKRDRDSQRDYLKALTSEFCLASSLHHTNIIETLDLLRDENGNYCGVMEFCAGGDLYSLIAVNGKLETLEADCFFKQMARAVVFMHDRGIAHRDLKPENILLTSRGVIRITDFGNAEYFRMAWETEVHLCSQVIGSGPYIAPEIFSGEKYDPRPPDVWALGIIYMAMVSGRHLWSEAKTDDMFYARYLKDRKEARGYEPIERLDSAARKNVIYSVLDPRAGRRLTTKQILQSEWGRKIHVCEKANRKVPESRQLVPQTSGLTPQSTPE